MQLLTLIIHFHNHRGYLNNSCVVDIFVASGKHFFFIAVRY
jgi:hypothetical protein